MTRRRQGYRSRAARLGARGITSARNNSSWEDFQIYEEIQRDGKLTARISEWLAFNDFWTFTGARSAHPQSDNVLRTSMPEKVSWMARLAQKLPPSRTICRRSQQFRSA